MPILIRRYCVLHVLCALLITLPSLQYSACREDAQFYFHNGVRTTALPRPNAYIPDSDMPMDLPVPKPYGAYTPFKPAPTTSLLADGGKSGGSAALRFYRKPVVKSIEL
jgi:hypothetical protein